MILYSMQNDERSLLKDAVLAVIWLSAYWQISRLGSMVFPKEFLELASDIGDPLLEGQACEAIARSMVYQNRNNGNNVHDLGKRALKCYEASGDLRAQGDTLSYSYLSHQ
jgi:hypothetical protein